MPVRFLSSVLCAALGATLSLALACAPRPSARPLYTVLEDDELSLFSPQSLPRFMHELRWLGVDELRISAEWKLEAPNPNSTQPPGAFRADLPSSYHADGIRLLDAAVRAAASAGLNVIIDPAFSAPLWATSDQRAPSASGDPWYNTNVDVHQAAAWEQMLASRYSGRFAPYPERSPLPRVQTFTLWNEPNEQGYLTPQWQGGVPVSADWYRALAQLAYPAIKRVSPGATVLIGDTSAAGGDPEAGHGGVPPLAFIRRLACVDAELRPVHDGACAGFQTVPADGYAQHPYERTAPPWLPSGPAQPDWAQTGDLPRLQALLDRLVAMHRLAPGAQNLWLTEQGYASNGELADMPWTEAQQAQLNAVSEYLAWRDGQLVSFSQFLLQDTLTSETLALRRRTGDPHALLAGTWTTGLLRQDGVPKPALWMFRSPIIARIGPPPPALSAAGLTSLQPASSQQLELWGRARPVSTPTLVQVELSYGGRPFQVAQATTTDESGIFDLRIAMPAGMPTTVRFKWLSPDGSWQTSPAAAPIVIPGS